MALRAHGLVSEHSPAARRLVFSGVQPTGLLTLGNYLGALKKFAELQTSGECIYSVVDLHAISVPIDPATLADNTRMVAAGMIASGVDPARSTIFVQSAVRAHTELTWVLNCTARMGWLERMTQFKDKAGDDQERASIGLFTYPVLMAADVLVYKATHVPVGEDQKQHLELARDIAQKFNHDFRVPNFFPMPEPLIQGPGARIMSLRDGTKKMSKSDPSDMSRICLTDDPDSIRNKIARARTDTLPLPHTAEELEDRPHARNLVAIHCAISGRSMQSILDEFGGQGFGAFKPVLAQLIVDEIGPITARMREILANPSALNAILRRGAVAATDIAEPVMRDVRRIVGFWS